MNRTKLINNLKIIAQQSGYDFYTSTRDQLVSTVRSLPAMWLSPPDLHSIEGHSAGRVTFAVTILLIKQGRKLSPEQKAAATAYLEENLLEMLEMLSQTPLVATIDKLEITASTNPLISSEECAIEATALIETIF